MVKISSKKLPAGTLIEVLIALVMIMAVFTIASQIYTNIMLGAPSEQRLFATQQINQLLDRAAAEKNIDATLLVRDSISYHIEVKEDGTPVGFAEVTITAEQQGTRLATGKRLIALTVE